MDVKQYKLKKYSQRLLNATDEKKKLMYMQKINYYSVGGGKEDEGVPVASAQQEIKQYEPQQQTDPYKLGTVPTESKKIELERQERPYEGVVVDSDEDVSGYPRLEHDDVPRRLPMLRGDDDLLAPRMRPELEDLANNDDDDDDAVQPVPELVRDDVRPLPEMAREDLQARRNRLDEEARRADVYARHNLRGEAERKVEERFAIAWDRIEERVHALSRDIQRVLEMDDNDPHVVEELRRVKMDLENMRRPLERIELLINNPPPDLPEAVINMVRRIRESEEYNYIFSKKGEFTGKYNRLVIPEEDRLVRERRERQRRDMEAREAENRNRLARIRQVQEERAIERDMERDMAVENEKSS